MASPLSGNEKKLRTFFATRKIPTANIAFYNEPTFRAAENDDPAFLDHYAVWVRARKRSKPYDEHVRRVVPKIAELVEHEIAKDTQLGICIDASMMLSKMLEEQGIWNYGAKGCLTVHPIAANQQTHFWMFDIDKAVGHTWIVAPPFEIIDIALRHQQYTHGEAESLPRVLLVEKANRFKPTLADYCSSAFLRHITNVIGYPPKQISEDVERVTDYFPAYEVKTQGAFLTYVTCGITVSDGGSLHDITSRRWNGRLAGELYDEIIVPALNNVNND